MMGDLQSASREHIFISYRRDDARGASGRLYDWLRIGFGRGHVFRDVHSIGVGRWRDKINDALARSAACVAVIGPRWANADNLSRLNRADDMVRHELATALADRDIVMVPTLVEGAEVPKAAALPRLLRPLFDTWNARRVTEDRWENDTRSLIAELAEETRLMAQGDEPGALAAYRKMLGIAEALTARDPANAQWQTDVAASCAKLSLVDHGQSIGRPCSRSRGKSRDSSSSKIFGDPWLRQAPPDLGSAPRSG